MIGNNAPLSGVGGECDSLRNLCNNRGTFRGAALDT
jgi:hypothetical protein